MAYILAYGENGTKLESWTLDSERQHTVEDHESTDGRVVRGQGAPRVRWMPGDS